VALEAGLLRESVFVALVVMALATSLVSGPMMKWLLREEQEESLDALVARGAFVARLSASTPTDAIDELVSTLGVKLGPDLEARARRSVLEREATASTGLGDEVAVPHAAVAGLQRPALALGLAPEGIDF